jgi:hypothetical protein
MNVLKKKQFDMGVNNFKELQKEQIKRFDKNTNRVGKNIKTNIDNFKFVGSLLELYLTTAIGFIVGFTDPDSKDSSSEIPNKYPNK